MISSETKPLVTVIGAGVSGLSAAHELIERGYKVQVVDPRRSQFEEYACEVGGLAATQYGRIKETKKLYPEWYKEEYLYKEWGEWMLDDNPPAKGDRSLDTAAQEITVENKSTEKELNREQSRITQEEIVLRLRSMKMQSVSPIVPFKERILFEPETAGQKELIENAATRLARKKALEQMMKYRVALRSKVHDYNGVANGVKTEYLGLKFLLAVSIYRLELRLAMLDIGVPFSRMVPEVKVRETLLLEVVGAYPLHSERSAHEKKIASRRAKTVKGEIVKSADMAVKSLDVDAQSFSEFLCKLDKIGEESQNAEKAKYSSSTDNGELDERGFVAKVLSAMRQFITDTVYNQDEFHAAVDALDFIRFTLREIKLSGGEKLRASKCSDHDAASYLVAVSRPEVDYHRGYFRQHDVKENEDNQQNFAQSILDDGNRVEFSVIQHVVAGEHGFRLFPAWYRNLFDTMRRTPLLDTEGRATQDTMMTQLRTPPETEFSIPGKGMVKIPKTPEAASGEENVNDIIRKSLSLSRRDTFRMIVQSLKFQTSGAKRRRLYEEMSWLRFVDGRSELEEQPSQTIRPGATGFSESGEKFMREFPQALVAMRPEESDARTFGSVEAQVGQDFEKQGEAQDQILNGPTSDVWLARWKMYLKNQGVNFYAGSLKKLHGSYEQSSRRWRVVPEFDSTHTARRVLQSEFRLKASEEKPVDVEVSGKWISCVRPYAERGAPKFKYNEAEYFVLAVPYQLATEQVGRMFESLRRKHPGFELSGDFAKLFEMGVATGCLRESGEVISLNCGMDGKIEGNWGQFPIRQLVGVQYFYSHQVQVGSSHVYYYDSPWALTSIAHGNYWLERPSSTHGYLGHLSVDVGDTYHRSENGKFFWNCDRQEIAESTLVQIYTGLDQVTRDSIAKPSFFHVDDAVPSFKGCPNKACPKRGKPGKNCDPKNCESVRTSHQSEQKNSQRTFQKSGLFTALPGQWKLRPSYRESQPIEYNVSYGQWVFAGNHMPTHTRLATMEAANESGRHAVTAIVQHAVSNGVRTDSPPKIWNPEEFEPGNFDKLKALDDKLMEKDLPHFLDILGVLKWIDGLSHDETPSKLEMFQHLADAAKSTTGVMSNPAYEMIIRHLGRKIEQFSDASDSMVKASALFKKS